MTIKDRIQAIASTIADKFYYGRNNDINIQADDKQFPAVVMIEPDSIGFNFNTIAGTIKRTSTVFIRFLDLLPEGIDIAEQANDRLATIDAMTLLAAEFVNAIINDEEIELVVTGQSFQVQGIAVIDAYDAHLCGIEIQLPLRLVYPEQICP